MELVEVKCKNCGKEIYVLENYLKDNMFCTLGCLSSYKEEVSSKGTKLSLYQTCQSTLK